jgi:hypothetical protein
LDLAAVNKHDCKSADASCPYVELGVYHFPISLDDLLANAFTALGGGSGWGDVDYRICDPSNSKSCIYERGNNFPNGGVVTDLDAAYPGCGFVERPH